MHRLKWILIITTSVCLLWMGGCYGLIKLAANSNTCDRFNIDNIEVHSRTNIPAVKSVECHYDAATNIKSNRFELDTKGLDMAQYINRNGFVKTAAPDNRWSSVLARAGKDIQVPETGDFYASSGQYKTESWYFLLDKSTGMLWCALQY